MNKKEVLKLLNASVEPNGWTISTSTMASSTSWASKYETTSDLTCWEYWIRYYYPLVIKETYPVYIQERAVDKGTKAFEIIKVLRDKKLIEIKTVKQFIDLMDALIKIL